MFHQKVTGGIRTRVARGLALCAALHCAQILTAAAVTFTNDTAINYNNTAFDGLDIVVSNCTLTVDGSHPFNTLQVLSGGKLTHTFAQTGVLVNNNVNITGEQHVLNSNNVVDLANTNIDLTTISVSDLTGVTNYAVTVDFNSLLDTNGFPAIQRTDTSSIPDGATVQVAYTITNPPVLSGVNLTIAGDVLVDTGGAINLDGKGYAGIFGPGPGFSGGSPSQGNGGSHGGYGGINAVGTAGGSAYDSILQPTDKGSGGGSGFSGMGGSGGGVIQLVAGGALHINGLISAKGLNATNSRSGGGAGGSLWLSAQTIDGNGTIAADGGAGEPSLGGGGGGGRIAIYCTVSNFSGTITARGGNGPVPAGAGTVYSKLSSQSVGSLVLDNGSQTGTNTPLSAPEAFNVTVQGGAVAVQTANATISNLVVASNSAFIFKSTPILTVLANATIQNGGRISSDATAAGGSGQGSFTCATPYSGGGGGYGGAGAPSTTGQRGGFAYGFITQPYQTGSQGGACSTVAPTGPAGLGGGAVQLTVNGSLALNGKISADGGAGVGLGSGGGSGGGIVLTVNGPFSGVGTISANGGPGFDGGGGGSGGRIGVNCYGANAFAGTMQAFGAGSGTNYAAAGTIYTQSYSPGNPQSSVLVDNGGHLGQTTTFSPTSALDVSVRGGGVLYWGTTATINNLFVASNSWLTFNTVTRSITINSNAVVQAGGGIIADAMGFPTSGSGAGHTGNGSIGSGGGYGGVGAAAGTATGGTTYGSVASPTDIGSAGGLGNSSSGISQGAGAAAIQLNVTRALTVDGRISAEGGAAVLGSSSGGGSGGSIWLTVGTLSGAGLISANGGSGDGLGGGGAGGRISVSYQSNLFTGTIRAWGAGSTGTNLIAGAGTIFTKSNFDAGLVLVDNGGRLGASSGLLNYSFGADLTIQNGGVVAPLSSLPSARNLLIGNNGWLKMTNNLTLNVSANATIQAGGVLTADASGSPPGSGQGAGRASQFSSGGGGHGGMGATTLNGQAAGGSAYDNMFFPSGLGSGGGNSSSIIFGGAGGGAINLSVTGILKVDGRLSVDGGASLNPGGGGGSGGSIYLSVGTLSGAGSISANGGAGNNLGGGGGGGRIAVYYTSNKYSGIIQAQGGVSGTNSGGAGTIYTKTNNQSTGVVVVDNGGHNGTNTTLGSSSSSQFDLTIRGGASMISPQFTSSFRNLLIASNAWWLVTQNPVMTFSGNLTIQAGGGMLADGLGPVYGSPGSGGNYGTAAYGQTGGGGGNGGLGASSAFGPSSGPTVGNITLSGPLTAGAAGGIGSGVVTRGGLAGGSIALNVNGTISLDGRLSANGGDGVGLNSGGASGGSILLNVGTLTGAGVISANGGAGNAYGGGGGGGRIAINYTSNLFTGTTTACAGSGGGPTAGGAGTIYVKKNASSLIRVTVDNAGQPGTNTPIQALSPFDLTIANGAVAYPSSGYLTLSNLTVTSGASLNSAANQTNLDLAILNNAVIQAGGAIIVDGKGFPAGSGTGAGTSLGGIGSGGGYGGHGGASSQQPGGGTYGSAQQPVDRGSGGGIGFTPNPPNGAGGGAVRLTVGGTLQLDGSLSANGNAGVQDSAGGGSGGSIWVTAGALTGAGSISADGGAGDLDYGGGGGGGRIAIYTPTNNFNGPVLAAGATGFASGLDGSIFLSTILPGLQIIAQTPSGIVNNAVTTVDFTFNDALNPNSFSTSAVALNTPNGAISPSSITPLATTQYRATFPQQSELGNYLVTVGTQVTDPFGQPMSQTYTGMFTIVLPEIQGTVTDTNGVPVPGVVLQPDGGLSPTTTDTNGNYALGITPGWTGTVTPSNPGFMFVPGTRSYTNFSLSVSNENYVMVNTIAAAPTSVPQGTNLAMSWYGIAGVTYQLQYSTDLITWLPYGGTVVGTNGITQVLLPIDTQPSVFFRVSAGD